MISLSKIKSIITNSATNNKITTIKYKKNIVYFCLISFEILKKKYRSILIVFKKKNSIS